MTTPDVAISDLTEYTDQMDRSIEDKLFCVPFLETCDVIVDFGCADGQLLTALRKRLPDPYLYGVDTNRDMLGYGKFPKACTRVDNFDTVLHDLKHYKRPGLILSSVLHEVYHQHGDNSPLIEKLWASFAENFHVICIRDMCVDHRLFSQPAPADAIRRLKDLYPQQVVDFAHQWWNNRPDHIWQESDLLHFLLKYRYTKNWEREVREDYFGLSYDELIYRINSQQFRGRFGIDHLRHFAHPFTVQQINRDTGIRVAHKTHIECVLRKR